MMKSQKCLSLCRKAVGSIARGYLYRVGGTKKIRADIRLIVATNRNLEAMVKEGKFREDLYYRICVFPIHLPPLRNASQIFITLSRMLCRRSALI